MQAWGLPHDLMHGSLHVCAMQRSTYCNNTCSGTGLVFKLSAKYLDIKYVRQTISISMLMQELKSNRRRILMYACTHTHTHTHMCTRTRIRTRTHTHSTQCMYVTWWSEPTLTLHLPRLATGGGTTPIPPMTELVVLSSSLSLSLSLPLVLSVSARSVNSQSKNWWQ